MRGSYEVSSYLFQKAAGVIFLIAFVSFGVQAAGLIGSGGILPIGDFLKSAKDFYGASAFWRAPTVLWWDSSDAMLRATWIAGAIFAVAAILGALPRVALAACVVLYLSIMSAGQTFMTFQWDLLLIEAGVLAALLDGTWLRAFLVQWLLFRLMFLSGLVKLTSGDPTWRGLTALRYHYETQPLPTPIAWYMQQLPPWMQTTSVVFVFVAELLAPLLLFGGRRLRPWAAAAIVGLQLLIALTGNYTFFNYLTIALCLMALDDQWWPAKIRALAGGRAARRFAARWPAARRYVSIALIAAIVPISLIVGAQGLGMHVPVPATRALEWISPFGLVNSYGLFANMTTERPEIIVEASIDGENWKAYEFRFKPGDPKRRPAFVAPYQPRLDWQMWFAALGTFRENPWFVNMMVRLLEARPEVLDLIGYAPFGRQRPQYVRASVYLYNFTDWGTRSRTGDWWRREQRGLYFPPVKIR